MLAADAALRQVGMLAVVAGLLLVLALVGLQRRNRQLAAMQRTVRLALDKHNPIFDALPDLVALKDTHGRYLACNERFGTLFGNTRQVIGKTDFDLLDTQTARNWRSHDRQAIEMGEPVEVEEWLALPAQGFTALLRATRQPVYEDGNLIGVLTVARDVTQQRVTEQEAGKHASYQRALLDNLPYLAWMKDAYGRFLAVNDALVEAMGAGSRQEVIGKTDRDLWPSELAEAYRADDSAVMRSRAKKEAVEQVQAVDGKIWVETFKAPIIGEQGEILGTVGFARDVSRRLEAERAIRDSERRLRESFQKHAAVMVFIEPDSGRIVDVNEAAIAYYGYTRERLLAMTVDELNTMSPEQVAQARSKASSGLHNHFEFEHRLASGETRQVEVYSSLIEHDGKPQLMSIIHDITQRKRLELTLVDERRRLGNVIEGTGVGTWEWNVQSGETRFNERWAEMIGYTLDELAPVSINTWMRHAHPGDLAKSEALLKQHFAGESDQYEFEARMRHRDGHWVWVLDRGRVFEWTDDGQPLWMYGTHQDITGRKLAELQLRENEQRLQIAGQSAYDIVYEYDVEHDQLDWYGDVDSMLGYPRDRITSGIDRWLDTIHPEDRERVAANMGTRAAERDSLEMEYRVRHADGGYRLWRDRAEPVCDAQGEVTRWIANCTDVTDQRINEERLRLAATVFAHAHEGILITDADTRIIDVNTAFTRITGYSREEAIGRKPSFLSSGRQDAAFYEAMWSTLKREDHWIGEVWNRRKDGKVYAETLAISAVRDDAGSVQRYVALFSDITMLKMQQEQLSHIAYYDALTDLPNRVLLGDRLEHEMRHAERDHSHLAVVYLDLDGFKEVNDAYGHDVGDRVLVEVATRLSHSLRADDTLARLGGDEFVAILSRLDNPNSCVELLPRMLASAAQPLLIDGHEISVSASLGVTLYPQSEPIDPDQLLRQADQAMYQAKLGGKNCYHFFDDEQDRNIRGRAERIEELRSALQSGKLQLHYQPKVNMHSGEVIGVEALIRWPQADGSMRMPADFLPLIEHNRLAAELDEWVMDTALRQLEQWDAAGTKLQVSVNISAYHLQQNDFGARLAEVLARHPGIAHERLTIEVLETTALMDLQRMRQVILDAQAMGVVFALDDFGTGYSSLDYLKNLPARELKIDRGFVRDMLDDRDDLAILEGIVGLATAFRRDLVAEGVENVDHGELLIALGCEVAQGYGIGRPMPAGQLPAWAKAWQPDPRWLDARPIARDDLPVIFAMVEHRAWVNALKSQLNGRHLHQPELAEHACQFGRWLDHEGANRYGDQGGFATIRGLHHRIHELAPSILDQHQNGDPDAAQQGLQRLLGMRDSLLTELRQLLRSRTH